MKDPITNSLNEFIQALDIVDFDEHSLKTSSFARFKDTKDRHGAKAVSVTDKGNRIYWGENHRSGVRLTFNPDYQKGKKFTAEERARYQAYKLIREQAKQEEDEARKGKLREIVKRMRHLESLTFLEDHDLPYQYLWNKGLNPIGKKLCTADPREIEAIVKEVYHRDWYTIKDKTGRPTRAHVLIVPMLTDNETLGIQLITTDGNKHFISGSIKGYWQSVSNEALERAEVIAIGEGLATMLSIEEVCKVPVIVSFDAGKLPPITRLIRALYPRAKLMITGDRDQSQAGQNKALEAIKGLSNVIAVIPQWDESEEELHPLLKTSNISDFNDYYLAIGRLSPPPPEFRV